MYCFRWSRKDSSTVFKITLGDRSNSKAWVQFAADADPKQIASSQENSVSSTDRINVFFSNSEFIVKLVL